MIITKKSLLWEVECDTREDFAKLGTELCDVSHKGIGAPVKIDGITCYFHLIINGLDTEIQSPRDLWFIGRGIQTAVGTLPLSFANEPTKKMVN